MLRRGAVLSTESYVEIGVEVKQVNSGGIYLVVSIVAGVK